MFLKANLRLLHVQKASMSYSSILWTITCTESFVTFLMFTRLILSFVPSQGDMVRTRMNAKIGQAGPGLLLGSSKDSN
jgi:hypothetical protein